MLFAQQRPLFPLPGLYLIEIALLGILGLIGLLLIEGETTLFGSVMPWIAAGSLLIRTRSRPVFKYIGLFLIMAILQATLMFIIARR